MTGYGSGSFRQPFAKLSSRIIPFDLIFFQTPVPISLKNCKDDQYDAVKYLVKDSEGKEQEKFLKIKYTMSDWYYYQPDAVKACQDSGAELWDVLDGEPEWNAVTSLSQHRAKFDDNVWISGKVETGCPGTRTA